MMHKCSSSYIYKITFHIVKTNDVISISVFSYVLMYIMCVFSFFTMYVFTIVGTSNAT